MDGGMYVCAHVCETDCAHMHIYIHAHKGVYA